MKKYLSWHICFLLALLTLSMQSCLGFGGSNNSSNFQTTKTSPNGPSIGINTADQAVFKGKIYFTLDRNLCVLDGRRTLRQLTHGIDVRDPAVSPNGKWVAFIIRHKDYSDLVYMAASGGPWKVLRTGQGAYYPNPPYPAPRSTHHWYAQPSWSADGTSLLFLSDIEKENWYQKTGQDAPLLDLQAFSIPFAAPTAPPVDVAYADYGDGGDRDASYRPHSPNQVVYTHYTYDNTHTRQLIQIFLEDATMIAKHPGVYYPGTAGSGLDPAVPLTPADPSIRNIQPAFSPDGSTIAYVRGSEPATRMGLYVMRVAEGVTDDPNNAAIQKKALLPYQKSSLILAQQFVSQPTWSPDGQQIAYLTYTNNVFDIWLVTVGIDGKTGQYAMKDNSVQLTSANGHLDTDSRPFWTQ